VTGRTLRLMNEIPAVATASIAILVIVKPCEAMGLTRLAAIRRAAGGFRRLDLV
jgi:hypothetical protein